MGFRSLSVCTYLYILIQVVFHEREREIGRKNIQTGQPTKSSKSGTLYGKLNTVCIN